MNPNLQSCSAPKSSKDTSFTPMQRLFEAICDHLPTGNLSRNQQIQMQLIQDEANKASDTSSCDAQVLATTLLSCKDLLSRIKGAHRLLAVPPARPPSGPVPSSAASSSRAAPSAQPLALPYKDYDRISSHASKILRHKPPSWLQFHQDYSIHV